MLNRVPEAMNRMARNVVMRHPNTYNCNIFRKIIDRAEPLSGGLPTMGGMGVIASDDEENYHYEFIGNGYVMQATPFEPSSMMDRQDANNGSGGEIEFLIEPELDTVVLQKTDVIYRLHGNFIKMAFEIVDVQARVNIPPFCRIYVCNCRDDLHVMI